MGKLVKPPSKHYPITTTTQRNRRN